MGWVIQLPPRDESVTVPRNWSFALITPSSIDYLCAFSCSPSVAPVAILSAHFVVKETSFRVEDISKIDRIDRVKVKIDAVDGYDFLSIKRLIPFFGWQ